MGSFWSRGAKHGARELLEQAIADGMIQNPLPDMDLQAWSDAWSMHVSPTELENPALDPRTQRYQESSHRVVLAQPVTPGQWWEVARFRAPPRVFGFIQHIDQYGELIAPLGGLVQQQNSPYAIFDPGELSPLLWSLQLENEQTYYRSFWRSGNVPDSKPGIPFGGISPWQDWRFPWGSDSKVFITVPSGFFLSLYVQAQAPIPNIRSIAGRLIGYTQSAPSISAAWVARRVGGAS